ncbi:amidase domain-containing protein [Agromyces agglutinans]|uniref:amidase domain-containing protein n=1 Tax=Agromyces agglutinans TaxID=2662258 RepID=UPI001299904F|nr:amidase domain-containing protein [Agromyces agglutinans]
MSAFGSLAVAGETPATADRAVAVVQQRSADDTLTVAASAGAPETAAQAAAAAADLDPTITSGLSISQAPFTGGTQVTVAGEHLDRVAQVVVGATPAPIVAAGTDHLTFAVPSTADTSLGDVAVTFTDAAGAAADVELPTESFTAASGASVASAAAGASLSPASPEAAAVSAAAPVTAQAAATDALTLTYTTDPGIDAQVGYVLAYWSSYNSAQYPVISGYDCANFTSQSLIARGWTMDGAWYYDAATGAMSPTWTSSTAMRDWLLTRPDLATALDDSQRALVKVGDIAQFDWDGSGDRDHTAVVTRVERTANGTKVWVGGHTKDADFWDVDQALATGGGSVHYFSLS